VIHMFVQHAFFKRDDNDIGPYSWNITGTYKGNFCSVHSFVMVMQYLCLFDSLSLKILSLLNVNNFVFPLHKLG